jgi:hypothetical protein
MHDDTQHSMFIVACMDEYLYYSISKYVVKYYK